MLVLGIELVEVIGSSEGDHYLSFLATNLLLHKVRQVNLVRIRINIGINWIVLTDILHHLRTVDQAKRIPIAIISILLQKVVIYILNVVIRIRMLQVVIKLELDDAHDGIPTPLLHRHLLGCVQAPVIRGARCQSRIKLLLPHQIVRHAKVMYLDQLTDLAPHHLEDDDK